MLPLQQLSDIDFAQLTDRTYHPSPAAWEDQVLYFLMLDRFSDGNEQGGYLDNDGNPVVGGTTPLFTTVDAGDAVTSDADAAVWRESGTRFVGGTLAGLSSKIGYLKRLGITAIWISPVFKQVPSRESYHGYGIQNFLDVDPHFGTPDELRQVVETAHSHGIYVILDIIFNHSGDVFAYQAGSPHWNGSTFPVRGFNDAAGAPTLPFAPVDQAAHPGAFPDGAIWPTEFQSPETFTQKGQIEHWDDSPEFLEGDFLSLKDIHHGDGPLDAYRPSAALNSACEVFKYWMAFADIDGFRIDTVKHMDLGATRYFTAVIREFAMTLGKENFYLIGEITGGRERAFTTLELTGLNAALGIDDIPDKMEYLVKGYRNPADYFDLFRNSELVQKASHIWFRNRVVTMFDDHDQVRKGENKARFCADSGADQQLLSIVALNATTLGIPCLYYGSEQLFDGRGNSDRYIRETMLGGPFGAFRSRNHHCFNEKGVAYEAISRMLAQRRQHMALRRGRQYLRPISGNGTDFGLPVMVGGRIQSVVAWSRMFDNKEILCAINTNPHEALSAWVTIDNLLHQAGDTLSNLFTTDPAVSQATLTVEARNGKAVRLTVPPAGFVLYGRD